MNLKVPKKTNSFLVWSFNDILTVLLPLWLLCLISEFRYAPIDSFFAAPFYLSGNNWFGTGSFFFSAVLHKGGKYVAVAVAVSSLILFLLSYLKQFARLKPYRKVCLYVALSISACALIISGLKSLSASPCPWSLPQYGGSGSSGKCFPAGHASSGFCLFALYFAFRQLKFKKAWIFLILAFVLGWILGLGRQAQGAPFPLSFFCDDVFGLGHLRLVLQVIFLSKSSDKNSPKTHFYASLLLNIGLLPYFHF